MTDGETSSDTLRERLEKAKAHNQSIEPPWKVANDAIEYAAQLEDQVETLQDEQMSVEAIEEALAWRDERDEARAERDLLHDALEYHGLRLADIIHDGPDAGIIARCALDGCDAIGRPETIEHDEGCLLREVERGDTVDEIRREAFEEAIDFVRTCWNAKMARLGDRDPCPNHVHAHNLLRDMRGEMLAEADDQENEPPYPCPDCGGAMFFHGSGKTLECPDCDQTFEADDQEDAEDAS